MKLFLLALGVGIATLGGELIHYFPWNLFVCAAGGGLVGYIYASKPNC